jgi:hypothetical protein
VDKDTRERLSDVLAIGALTCASGVLIDAGILCSNDGSHYALVRAIGDTGSFVIDPYVLYTRYIDISQYGGHFFSDRPPGTAMLAVPLYLLGRLVSSVPAAHEFSVTLLSVLAAWVACSATYWIARQLGHSRAAARVAAITLALATPLRSYASTLFHHATAAALVSVVAALCLDHAARPRRTSRVVAALLAGYAVGVDYQTCLPTGVLLASALVPMRRERGPAVRALVEVVVAGGLGLVPLLVYDSACFEGPLDFANYHQVHFTVVHSISGIYGGSVMDGLFGLFFHPRSGLLFWSPVLLLVLFFAPLLARGDHRRGALCLGLAMLPFVVLTSRNYEVGAGSTRDARYLTPILPLFAVGLATAWDRALERARAGKTGLIALYVVLFTLSVQLQVVKHVARWVRNGEAWLPLFRSTTDPLATTLAFLGWAFPHPIAALAILVLGLVGARVVLQSGPAGPASGGSSTLGGDPYYVTVGSGSPRRVLARAEIT